MQALLILVGVLLAALAFVAGYFTGQRQRRRDDLSQRAAWQQLAADMVQRGSSDLRRLHRDTLLEMLDPLDRDLKEFHHRFVTSQATLNTHIEGLLRQTQSVGQQAEELTRALRGNNKMQGNWGEGILANVLAVSGLEEGRDFDVQVHLPDGLIPDVVVHLPGNRHLVVDAKVSLTAFVAYANAESPEEQQRYLRQHLDSVRSHIHELSAKHYERRVEGAVGYVLMFVPHEAAYVAAVSAQQHLAAEAYKRHVILVNPGNLLMALQLAENLWQSERQSHSVQEIYASAEKLYKKFSLFAENFQRIGTAIHSLETTYQRAVGQLTEGPGNIVHQLEGWKKKGLSTAQSLPPDLLNRAVAHAEAEPPISAEPAAAATPSTQP